MALSWTQLIPVSLGDKLRKTGFEPPDEAGKALAPSGHGANAPPAARAAGRRKVRRCWRIGAILPAIPVGPADRADNAPSRVMFTKVLWKILIVSSRNIGKVTNHSPGST